ncbi:transglutaminase family protein [Terribacillus sp. DMT04]|uniref:transglutaminase-like domain-containing protein n=1 Tax=Terribacillus sp. DMT04 TaxID=2850441 RepID=UPI001C2BBFE9|nr:transglutaminase family protein [Terribacillus sp. DMT04]QXE02826.1 transglutaminase family protein [Terribacillus sp. DMT04]
MQLLCESESLEEYLLESNEVDYTKSIVKEKIGELFNPSQTEIEKVRIAFEFVRDEIAHSWDIQSVQVTCKASEVIAYKEGICYAKSHLLAALLRSQGIPTGFCYQRLMLFDVPEKGYCIHALNAVYLQSMDKWVRLDARGNKKGINAQFSVDKEKLAFITETEKDEIDYPVIYTSPHPDIVAVLNEHADALDMYKHYLPTRI